MTERDPIASATLARLYLTQGHTARARAILDEVLARTPLDGDALALHSRLSAVRPRLAVTVEGSGLALRWQGVPDPDRVHVVISLHSVDAHGPRQWVTSRPCTGAFGRHGLTVPWARGVLVASLGRVEPGGYAPLVVAEPLGWG